MRLSHRDLPFFFEAEHQALGARLERDVQTDDLALHAEGMVVARLRDLRLLELLVPTTSSRLDVRSLCLAREALGYCSGLADSVFAVQGLGAHPVVLDVERPGRDTFLAEVASGARVGAFALTESEAGSDVASLRSAARRDGDGWVLDGEKVFISNVGIATHYVVFANADPAAGKRGISAFLVERASPGLHEERIALSAEHPLGRVRLEGCRVPERALLGQVGQGLRLALGTLDVFRTSVGAAAVGMARRALDESVARVRARVQFGKPLADFQLTQAALADMATELDAARLLVYRAAWYKDVGLAGGRDPRPVAMAKMFATEAAQRIIDRAVQLHGGLGVTLGTPVERLYREIRPLRIYEGTTEIQRLIIGAAVAAEAGPAAGT